MYLFLVVIIVGGFSFLIWQYFNAPTCFDGKQNGSETGIDCGGSCAKECLGEIKDLIVNWSKALDTGNGKYDLVAMVENPNPYLAVSKVVYQFKIYDKDNILMASQEGETFLFPSNTFPVFYSGVSFGSRIPAGISIEFQKNIDWERVIVENPRLFVSSKNFYNLPTPKLNILIENKSPLPVNGFSVAAVLYNKDKNTIGVSVTFIDNINSEETKEIIFTWSKSFSQEPDSIEIFFKPFLQ
jgi:hypothetical protein